MLHTAVIWIYHSLAGNELPDVPQSDSHTPGLSQVCQSTGVGAETQGSRLLQLSCFSSPSVGLFEPGQLSIFCAVLGTKDKGQRATIPAVALTFMVFLSEKNNSKQWN